MPRPSARGRFLPAAALVAFASASVGCDGAGPVSEPRSDGAPPVHDASAPLDLVAHAPDGRREQPGVLRPDPHTGWGRAAGAGWDRRPRSDEDVEAGEPTDVRVWTDGARAVLRLPVLAAADRRIAIAVVARAAGAPVPVEFRLGGSVIGSTVVDEVPVELEFDAPAALWSDDPARLELAIGRTREVWRSQRDGGRVEHGLAVARVTYAGERPVEWSSEGGLVLTDDTHARYALERDTAGARRLTVRGRVEGGGGELALALVERTGSTTVDEAFGPVVRRPLERGGAFALDLDPVVDLGAGARRDVALRVGWSGAGSVVVEALELERTGPVPSPPVVFVSIDTLAARSLGAYGYERETSANLDAFARECVLFENCLANTTWTAPSYISQFTGTLPHANRVVEADGDAPLSLWDERLVARERWTLAEALRARGYRTGAVVANTWLALTRGIARGFDHFDDEAAEHAHTEPGWGAPLVFERALEWLASSDEAVPFAFVQVLDVHSPYAPSEGWRGRFGSQDPDAATPLPVVGGQALVARSLRPSQVLALGEESATADAVSPQRMRAIYDENLAEFDADFGAFVEELRRMPWFDDALVIVSADHGEAMDEPRFVFDHFLPERDVLHVPLLVRLPRGARGGTRVAEEVQLVDLYPTVLEAVGLPTDGRGLAGRSLWPLLRGDVEAFGATRSTPVHDGGSESRALVDGRWKLVELELTALPAPTLLSIASSYERWAAFDPDLARLAERAGIRSGSIAKLWIEYDDPLVELPSLEPLIASLGRFYESSPGVVHELYDLEHDPFGLDDVAAEHPERVAAMAERLTASRRALEGTRPSLAANPDDGVDAGANSLELLKELGYLGGE